MIVELDEWFFESFDTDKSAEEQRKGKKKKRGRGSQKQSAVMVMVSPVHDSDASKKQKKPTKFRYVCMAFMDNQKSETVDSIIKHNIQLWFSHKGR